jgi:hypothetical protein
VGRIQEAITHLWAQACLIEDVLRGHGRAASRNREIDELAQSILDYGRMRLSVYPKQEVVVEVDELAFRLRETPRTINKVLFLLESERRAERTELDGLWRLHISSEIIS